MIASHISQPNQSCTQAQCRSLPYLTDPGAKPRSVSSKSFNARSSFAQQVHGLDECQAAAMCEQQKVTWRAMCRAPAGSMPSVKPFTAMVHASSVCNSSWSSADGMYCLSAVLAGPETAVSASRLLTVSASTGLCQYHTDAALQACELCLLEHHMLCWCCLQGLLQRPIRSVLLLYINPFCLRSQPSRAGPHPERPLVDMLKFSLVLYTHTSGPKLVTHAGQCDAGW